ncbi:MAG: hypothetical protein HZA53_08415 [Planctomycetes bacterium]|nr:hypothetical protein [Planctomycetota bacterium]
MKSRGAQLFLALALLACFAPLLLRGHVVFPHDNALQVGLGGDGSGDGETANLRFSDQSSFYVPELHAHLTAPRSGWIATWTDAVQMGRPLTHLSGFSPAYPPTWILMRFTNDAFTLYTWLAVLTVAATAFFAFAFFRALALEPWVCAAGACAAGLSLPVLYWLTFLMNVSGFCWTFCLLWLLTRYVERPTRATWLGLGAATALLLLSGYPQQVVWYAAYLAPWTIARVFQRVPEKRDRFTRLVAITLAGVVGVMAASPVLLDVALALSRSARIEPDPEFFAAALPTLGHWRDVAAQAALLVDPRLVGNAIEPGFPFLFSGVAFGALFLLAVLLSWRRGAWREHLPSYAVALAGLAMFFWPAFYLFGVEHLGLRFSPMVPTWGALVPVLVCGTMGLDALLRDPPRGRGVLCVGVLAALFALRACVAKLVPAGSGGTWWVVPGLAAAGLAALFFVRRGWAVAAVVAAGAFLEGRELVLERPRAGIHVDSPLVTGLRERLAEGGRYALVGEQPKYVLPANQELLLGLSSPHSYDSLSPREYQEWTLRISKEGTRRFGRRFNRIADDARLASGELEKAGITHVLSARPLSVPSWKPDAQLGPFRVYATGADATRALLLPAQRFQRSGANATTMGAWTRADAEAVQSHGPRGDEHALWFERTEGERLLVLRRQFHPQWKAWTDPVQFRCGVFPTPPVCAPLECVLVDGFYQGVIVPAGVDDVLLEFRPWARWAWVPWVGFALAFVLAAFLGRRRSA